MKQVFWCLRQVAARLPFTLTMLVLLGGTALITGSHNGRLEPAWRQQLGFSMQDLEVGQFERLFSSAVITHGGPIFWQAIGMVALAVGTAEWLIGSRYTIIAFWGIHLLTLLTESWLIVPYLHLLTNLAANSLQVARDVGPSAGYFGCLGLAVWHLPGHWRMGISLTIFIGLVIAFLRPLHLNEDAELKLLANVAHLLAFPLGLFSTPLLSGGMAVFQPAWAKLSTSIKGQSQ